VYINIWHQNNGLLGKGVIQSFSLDVRRIIGSCHFYIALMVTMGLIFLVREVANFFCFFGGGDWTAHCDVQHTC